MVEGRWGDGLGGVGCIRVTGKEDSMRGTEDGCRHG